MRHKSYCRLWLLLIMLSTNRVCQSATLDMLAKLKKQILVDPFDTWIYRDSYGSLSDLGVHYSSVNRSIHYPRLMPSRMKNVIYRALNGQKVTAAVIGGSISAGATLYRDHNEDKIFFLELQDYWNAIVKPVTGSELEIKNFAIGATGSDFYSYCLENYLQGNETDMVIWELSANDYHRFDNRDVPPTLPLEILTRSVLHLEKQPALIYAHFFRGKDYKQELDCDNLEVNGANYVSKYYKIPSVSWKQLVCRMLTTNEKVNFNKLFARDSSHPSLLGHAQMGFLLIHLFRKLFLKIVDDLLTSTMTDTTQLNLFEMPVEAVAKPIYTKTLLVADDPICFTFNTPSNGQLPRNRKKILRVVRNDGYTISTAHGFLIRKDKTQGLRTKEPNKELHLQINVPVHKKGDQKDWMILIGSYSNFGGAVFFLDGKYSRIIQTEKYAYGSIVAAIATHVKSGSHDLVIKSITKGFFLSSIMLG